MKGVVISISACLAAAALSAVSCSKPTVTPETGTTPPSVNLSVFKRGVVKIIAHKPQHVKDTGAGIVAGIEKNIVLILTAHHVVESAEKIEVVFFEKQFEKLQGRLFEKYDEDLDLAVVTVEPVEGRRIPPDLPGFSLGDMSKLREGEKVSTIGHPLDLEWQATINTNTIAGLSDRGDFRKFRFTKSAIERGNSGGPVFDERGSLIGMVTKLDPVHAAAVKIDAAILLLQEEWRILTTNLTRLGTISVDSRPSGAQVFLDGRPVGSTAGPLHVTGLEAREYSVRVTKEGYKPWEKSVQVEVGKQRSILAELESADVLPPPPSPFLRRRW